MLSFKELDYSQLSNVTKLELLRGLEEADYVISDPIKKEKR